MRCGSGSRAHGRRNAVALQARRAGVPLASSLSRRVRVARNANVRISPAALQDLVDAVVLIFSSRENCAIFSKAESIAKANIVRETPQSEIARRHVPLFMKRWHQRLRSLENRLQLITLCLHFLHLLSNILIQSPAKYSAAISLENLYFNGSPQD